MIKDYKSQTCTTKFTDRLQKTIKVKCRLQSLDIDYKSPTCTTKFTGRLQKLDIDCKVLLIDYKRLQNLLIDYKRLQKSDIDYKILLIPLTTVIDINLLGPMVIQSQPAAPIHSRQISDGEMVGVCREILQEPYSIFGFRNFIHRRAAQAKTHQRCAF